MTEGRRRGSRGATACAAAIAGALVACTSPEPFSADRTAPDGAPQFAGHIAADVRNSTPDWGDSQDAPARRPNIVIVLADDLGFADLGSFGSEIATPHLDRLASEGLRYRNFTVTGVCSPTRAALLTGMNHHSAGVGWLANMDAGYPGYRGEIAEDVPTLAETLRDAGYATLMVGKWHLTNSDHMSVSGPFDSWPTGRGFERFWGYLDGETNHWLPPFLWQGNEIVEVPTDGSFFFPDAMADRAIAMLRDLRAVDPEKPFLLYYAPHTPHAPHHTKPADRDRYAGAYARGWDVVRRERLERQKALGVAAPNAALAARYPGVRAWDDLGLDEQRMAARFQENYAAMIDRFDHNVGRVLDWLARNGELANTLVIVTSDNGASREVAEIGSWNALEYYHGLESTTQRNLAHYDRIGEVETHPHYPRGWMQASNTPFAWAKTMTHGGGVRAPLIISWPARIQDGGGVRDQFHHVIDLAPTILEAAGLPTPGTSDRTSDRLAVRPPEGTSLVYSFDDAQAPSQRREQYYEMEGHRGYVADGWKIVTHRAPGERWDEPSWELYHLDEDFAEYRDLASDRPGKVAELEEKWWRAAERFRVLPLDDRSPGERGRAAFPRMRSFARKRFVYEPGTHTIDRVQAPQLQGRSFAIHARVAPWQDDGDGVLVALGDRYSGYAFFVQNGRLHWVVNIAGRESGLSADEPIPAGATELVFEFEHTAGTRGGVARLRAGDTLLAEGALPVVLPGLTWEGLDIGRDLRLPVSSRYAAPFAFTGGLEAVSFDLHSAKPR